MAVGRDATVGPMNHSDTVVLLARQRSGTNALRDVLDSHPMVFCLPEVFQSEPSPKARFEVETNYFNFLDGRRERIKDILTSEDAQGELFLEYLTFLRTFSEKRFLLIDIKYNSAHNVDGPWRDIAAEPSLFKFVRDHGVRVLNLTRTNYLRFYLSWVKTNLTQRYHLHAGNSEKPVESLDEALTVDIDDLLFRLELCRSEDRLVAEALAGRPEYL